MPHPEGIRRALTDWYESRPACNVRYQVNEQPENSAFEDYSVAFEATFNPVSEAKSYIEIWVTPEGEIAIGFERWRRLARRLGVSYRRDQFAAGLEPIRMDVEEILSVLDLAYSGHISISVVTIPWIGIVSTKAVADEQACKQLKGKRCFPISQERTKLKLPLSRILNYEPWGRKNDGT